MSFRKKQNQSRRFRDWVGITKPQTTNFQTFKPQTFKPLNLNDGRQAFKPQTQTTFNQL